MRNARLFIPIMGLFLVLACTSKQSRAPSSDDGASQLSIQERMEVMYQSVLNSSNPEKDFTDLFSRLSSINARSISLVREFDKELNATYEKFQSSPPGRVSTDVLTSDTYIKINAAEEVARRTEEKIMYLYSRLFEDAQKAILEKRVDDFKKLNGMRENFHKMLEERSKSSDIFALEHLMHDLREYLVAENAKSKTQLVSGRNEVQRFDRRFGPNLLDSTTKIESALKTHGEALQQKESEAMQDNQINHDIEHEMVSIKQDIAAIYKELPRAPANSKVLFPSVGTNGNIVGANFPQGVWAITYDDGPHATHTLQIMKMFEAANMRASFFWLGQLVGRPALQPIIAHGKAKGHDLASHSQSHRNFGAVRDWEMDSVIQSEIIQPEQIMRASYGARPKFYRCPYGACNRIPAIRQALASRGYLHAFWNVDSLDWNKAANPNGASDITRRVRQQMEMNGRGVVLFHDIHAVSAEATRQLMPYFKQIEAQGGRIVTMCQAVDIVNGDSRRTFCP